MVLGCGWSSGEGRKPYRSKMADPVQDVLLGDTSGSDAEQRLSSAEPCGVDEKKRLQTAKKPTRNLGNCNDRDQLKSWYEHEKITKRPQFATEDNAAWLTSVRC